MGTIMSVELSIFLTGTFAAAYVTGLAGFAFGMVAAAIWLHTLTPVQTTALIVAYAFLVQGYAVWKLRNNLNMSRLMPFIAGSAIGIPAGVVVLKWASPSDLRIAVGSLLIAFSLYNFARPILPVVKGERSIIDGVVGISNGILGGATGLGGILPTIWCGFRGWTKDEQRAVFQPTAVATFLMTILWLGGAGTLTADVGRLFVVGLPALIVGTWLGWKSYGRLDEAGFRKVVLVLLLVSGVTLVAV
ncbi:MAG: sulfite exporter TauE/SafE family protein [Betaproteobacteria bacterium]|nr:sulfite exporter TauE/SafE family protein [Betaproteobacteria bacterium]